MNKAFTKEEDGKEPSTFRSRFQPLPAGFRNLITPQGDAVLRAELLGLQEQLMQAQGVPEGVHLSFEDWRALLRLQTEDLAVRLESQEVVALDAAAAAAGRVSFGATVLLRDEDGQERRYTLVGIDETDPQVFGAGRINWTSPLGRVLLHQTVGNVVRVETPKGEIEYEILGI